VKNNIYHTLEHPLKELGAATLGFVVGFGRKPSIFFVLVEPV
jgi:hypothetical protein